MPTPREDESKDKFIERCIPIVLEDGTAEDNDQAFAVCQSMWEEGNKSMSSKALTLSDQTERVVSAFFASFEDAWEYWPVDVYDDSLIVKALDGTYVKLGYTIDEQGNVEFGDQAEVQKEYKGSPLASRAGASPIRATGDNRYECCLVRFTDESERDAYGTYFDADTRYYLDWFDTRPWLYDHTTHKHVGKNKVGTWDTIELRSDGVFVQGELDRSKEYWEDIDTLIRTGVLYPSSGTLSYVMSVNKKGHVDDWPIVEGSSTVTPADINTTNIMAAARAYRRMEETNMSEEKRKGFLAGLFNRQDEPEPEPEVEETEAQVEEEEPVETEVEGDVDGNAYLSHDDGEQLAEYVKENRDGLVQLSDGMRALSEQIDELTRAVRSLGAEEPAKIKEAMRSGSFLGQLFVPSRHADDEDVEVPQAPASGTTHSPALDIARQQRGE